MKKVEVQWFKSKYTLSEISQGSGFLFSFLSAPKDGNMQVYQYVKCRDFLQDVIRTHITGKVCPVYGFSYTKGVDPPIDMRRTRMLVTKIGVSKETAKDFMHEIKCGLKIVNYFENIMEVKPTKICKISNAPTSTWLFNGSGVWMKAPGLISLYTFLIRLGYQKAEFDTYQDLIDDLSKRNRSKDRDLRYLKSVGSKLITVAKNYKEIFSIKPGSSYDPIYNEDMRIEMFHNYSGILSLCDGQHIETLKASKKLFAILARKEEYHVDVKQYN